jgi:hypothetical protein
MAWSTPYTFTALELLTAAKLNTMQDNIQFLYDVAMLPRYFGNPLNTDVALVVGDDAARFTIPSAFNGWNITSITATRKSGGTGVPTIQLRNVTDSVDVLSTKLTIDSGETSSLTAATPPVIDTTKDDVATDDVFAIDVDVAGTNTFFMYVLVGLTKP